MSFSARIPNDVMGLLCVNHKIVRSSHTNPRCIDPWPWREPLPEILSLSPHTDRLRYYLEFLGNPIFRDAHNSRERIVSSLVFSNRDFTSTLYSGMRASCATSADLSRPLPHYLVHAPRIDATTEKLLLSSVYTGITPGRRRPSTRPPN